MLLVEHGSELDGLSCRVCHREVRPGERVLVTYRKGRPSLIHASLCDNSQCRAQAHLIRASSSLAA